jgi:hypothetical protein
MTMGGYNCMRRQGSIDVVADERQVVYWALLRLLGPGKVALQDLTDVDI